MFIFTAMSSPKEFGLTCEQVEQLWDYLMIIGDLFNWFLYQAINKEQHALNIETFKLIFMNKLPSLDSNKFSQIALNLYEELFKNNNISIITIQIKRAECQHNRLNS